MAQISGAGFLHPVSRMNTGQGLETYGLLERNKTGNSDDRVLGCTVRAREQVDSATHMLAFRGSCACLQIVSQGYDGQQNQNEHHQRNNLNAHRGTMLLLLQASRNEKPQCSKHYRNSQPQQVEERFHS
jgi:hypothetical protein